MSSLKYIVVVLALLGCGDNGVNWDPSNHEPCETHQGNYEHTTIRCGDYYDDVIVLCDENSNYNRGADCLKVSDLYEIVADNKPCRDCGCVDQNICEY